MRGKVGAYLELIRVGNLFSAAADVLGGYYFASGFDGTTPSTTNLPLLLASSVCFYAGGVALNDVCDAERDAVERPNRPIPSGRVSRAAATRLAVTLLGIGTIVAMTVTLRATVLAGTLVTAIALYNFHAKSTVWGPLVMGLCRALNLGLGMDALPTLVTAPAVTAMLLIWLYIASVTFFARDEAGVSTKARLQLGTAGVAAAVLGLFSLFVWLPISEWKRVLLIPPFACFIVWIGLRTAADAVPIRMQSAVRMYLIGLIWFDSLLAWTGGGREAALTVAVLAVPMTLLTRWFRAS